MPNTDLIDIVNDSGQGADDVVAILDEAKISLWRKATYDDKKMKVENSTWDDYLKFIQSRPSKSISDAAKTLCENGNVQAVLNALTNALQVLECDKLSSWRIWSVKIIQAKIQRADRSDSEILHDLIRANHDDDFSDLWIQYQERAIQVSMAIVSLGDLLPKIVGLKWNKLQKHLMMRGSNGEESACKARQFIANAVLLIQVSPSFLSPASPVAQNDVAKPIEHGRRTNPLPKSTLAKILGISRNRIDNEINKAEYATETHGRLPRLKFSILFKGKVRAELYDRVFS